MKLAADKMADLIDNMNFHAPTIPVIPNALVKLNND